MLRNRIPAIVLSLTAVGCAPSALDDAFEETGILGPSEEVPEEGKFDGSAATGPTVAAGVNTEVWRVTRTWAAVEPEAGIAWSAGSGLDWEAKYDAWISSFQTEPRASGDGETFVIPTPYGERSFHAPTLECAEVAMFLRATFASWYHLPFFMQGWDATSRQTFYAGHFGFVTRTGAPLGRFPAFRTAYRDNESSWRAGQPWPSDSRLRGLRLGDDDAVEFLSTDTQERGAGAYFDEMFLNKRVGYFARLLLLYFGSVNLADGANMFHIEPDAVAAGDVLVHRWQKRGIGHVMPIVRVTRHSEEALEIAIASGSMPRREPVWEEPNRARSSFVDESGGGEGAASDGNAYAALGGGVRRWRTAVLTGGRWRNEVALADREAYINDADRAAIAARPARFGEILRSLSDEERVAVAIVQIEAARAHLRQYPASCAARVRREDAFEMLYEGMPQAEADATYRTLEDYVFSALVYEQSRTCCWNRSTAAMSEIVLDYADAEQRTATAAGTCVSPTVFRAETTGYQRWADHAATLGRGAQWAAWSEDETCAQRGVAQDTVDTARAGSAFCELGEPVPPMPVGAGCDAAGGGSQATAVSIPYNASRSARVCTGESDWFRVETTVDTTITISFSNAAGDLDMELIATDGSVIGSSAGVGDSESATARGPFFVRVFGYGDDVNSYSIIAR